MKKLVVLLFSLFLIQGCNKDNSTEPQAGDPSASKAKEQQAYSLMETEMIKVTSGSYNNISEFQQLKMVQINSLYREAIQLDPSNTNAQFGAAISEILSAFWDTTIYNVISEFEAASMNKPLSRLIGNAVIPTKTSQMIIPSENTALAVFSMYKSAIANPPLISRVQNMLRNNLLPKINFAITCLEACEANASFRFKISGKMQGDQSLDTVSIYRTEVFLTDALMHGIRSLLNSMLIYKFDLPDYSQASIVAALQQNSTSFFYINSDGQSRASTAKSDIMAVISKFRSGISDLQNISGTKPDAILRIGQNGLQQEDITQINNMLDRATQVLTSVQQITLNDADSEGNDYVINVNLGAMLTNMPANPKAAFLPAYTITLVNNEVKMNFNAATYDEFVFPDPTFGGIFPGMTNDVLKKILDIDRMYK